MKKRSLFSLISGLIFFSASLFSCQKELPPTIITGVVTNKTTGSPVTGAYIDCSLRKENWTPSQTKNNSTYTDFEGRYRLEIPQEYTFSFSAIYSITKYLTYVDPIRSNEIIIGETNIIDAALIPKDGILRLRFQNDLILQDSLYVNLFSPTSAAQPYIGGLFAPEKLPIVSTFQGVYEELFALPSEEFVTIYWGTNAFMPFTSAPFKDSIYLLRDDTVNFTIHF